jgi:hypothetical protein
VDTPFKSSRGPTSCIGMFCFVVIPSSCGKEWSLYFVVGQINPTYSIYVLPMGCLHIGIHHMNQRAFQFKTDIRTFVDCVSNLGSGQSWIVERKPNN